MWQWLQRFFPRRRPPSIGSEGERSAEKFLCEQRGFYVLARNWRSGRDQREEIDLVCRDRDVLVFVEVKSRAAGALVPGYFAVNYHKKKVLRRAIRAYLAQLASKPRTFRFDIVEVGHQYSPGEVIQRTGPAGAILHFENVALFPKGFRG